MTRTIPKCRITVLKRTLNQDLADQYLDAEKFGLCDLLQEGQQFIVEQPYTMPEGFCAWAWGDLRHEILAITAGANYAWIKERGVGIAGCSDWFRPVIFKIERME
jgi:uncharacterized repeat protein (TIGR04076 family)